MTLVGLFHENNDGSDYFNQNSKLKKNGLIHLSA